MARILTMTEEEQRPYRVAETYDPVATKKLPYPAIAAFIADRLRAHAAVEPRSILDIGCGTGNLTLELSRLGYQVAGLDRSAEMLAIAREKAARGRLPVDLIEQDMRRPYPVAPVDAVTCFYGVLSHLLSPEDLRRCFAAVHGALAPGGVLAFDLYSEERMRTMFSGPIVEDHGDFFFVGVSTPREAGIIDYHLTYFLGAGDGLYRREDEHHRYRVHSLAALRQILEEVGLPVVAVEAIPERIDAPALRDVSLVLARRPV